MLLSLLTPEGVDRYGNWVYHPHRQGLPLSTVPVVPGQPKYCADSFDDGDEVIVEEVVALVKPQNLTLHHIGNDVVLKLEKCVQVQEVQVEKVRVEEVQVDVEAQRLLQRLPQWLSIAPATAREAQRARHDAAAAAPPSVAHRSAPASATTVELTEIKGHLAEKAGKALGTALRKLTNTIELCQNQALTWTRTDDAVALLLESLLESKRLLEDEEPNTRSAATACDKIDESRKIFEQQENHDEDPPPEPTAIELQLKQVAKLVRDVMVFRVCWHIEDHRDRDDFLHECNVAFKRDLFKSNLLSKLLHSYACCLTPKDGIKAFESNNAKQLRGRRKRPRKVVKDSRFLGVIQTDMSEFPQDSIAEWCAESVLPAESHTATTINMNPKRIELADLKTNLASVVPHYYGYPLRHSPPGQWQTWRAAQLAPLAQWQAEQQWQAADAADSAVYQ
jgi:hypothetical protein